MGSRGPSPGRGRAGRAWGAGHATHKRFSSPRPRKAPGCTVLMTLFLRSLWEASGSLQPSPTLGATHSPGLGKPHFYQQCWELDFLLISSALVGRLDEGPQLSDRSPCCPPPRLPSRGAGQKDVRKNIEAKRWDGVPLGGNKEWSQH